MLIWVIFFLGFLSFGVFFGVSSSPEESESVASWSVRMIRRSLFFVLVAVLHDGLVSKFELGVFCFRF